MKRSYCRIFAVVISIAVLADGALAQQSTSTVSGTVVTDDGLPLVDARVHWTQAGHPLSIATDSAGKFAFNFAESGSRVLQFEHASTSATGSYSATFYANSELDLSVVLYRHIGNPDSWSVQERRNKSPEVGRPEGVISAKDIETQPGTESLWSLLNLTEPSVVADRFDISGLHSYRQLLIGVRGSSWTQNQAIVNGMTVSNPTGEGMLAFPDLSTMESVIYSVGDSASRHVGPGAHIELLPKRGSRELHGQARSFFQAGALQNTNPTQRFRDFTITESDERWKHFLNSGVQLGGPLGSGTWTYFGAVSLMDADKKIRNHPLPVTGNVGQETFNLAGEWSPGNRLAFYGSAQQRNEPQAEASPQVTRDSTIRQDQDYRQIQGTWTHAASSGRLLEVRVGRSSTNLDGRFQEGVSRQSEEELFPGYVVGGVFPRALKSAAEAYSMLSNIRRGAAPLVTSYDAGAWEASVNYSANLDRWGAGHQILMGASYRAASVAQTQESLGGVNLLMFYQLPYAVRLMNTAVHTRDRTRQLELNVLDRMSLSRLSFTFGTSADFSEGASVLSSGASTNSLRWSNVGGRAGAAFRVVSRRPLILRWGIARIYDQPTTNIWNTANPEGLGSRLFLWNDSNADRQFESGEAGKLLKVTGAPYTRFDPKLRNPATSEITMGLTQGGLWKFSFEALGFRRSTQRLMSLVNEGVPFSAYTAVQAIDYGKDAERGTEDDRPITVFNQGPLTLGQDRYVLTNPPGFSSHSEGMELKLFFTSRRVQWEAAVTRYRAVAETAPGITPQQNDTSAFLGIFDDPNKTIFARGSTFFDRGTLGRFTAKAELMWKLSASLIGSYQDGLPYSRLIVVEGLNQGIVGIRTAQRGPGEAGSSVGSMTAHYETLDMRLSRTFPLRSGSLRASLDIFNLRNMAPTSLEGDVTSAEKWRFPVRFETPRSLQLGLRYDW